MRSKLFKKQKMLKIIKESEKNGIMETSKKYKISPQSIYNWIKLFDIKIKKSKKIKWIPKIFLITKQENKKLKNHIKSTKRNFPEMTMSKYIRTKVFNYGFAEVLSS